MTLQGESAIASPSMAPLREKLADRLPWQLVDGARSENFGGLISLIGSCVFLLGGDTTGVIVTSIFLTAEIVFTRFGHSREGYSVGCLLICFGDALAARSAIANSNEAFQFALTAMAVVWGMGALRWPLAWYGNRFKENKFVKLADALQPLTALATLTLRIPGFAAAIIGTNYLGAIAIGCWAAADILLGRLRYFSVAFFSYTLNQALNDTESRNRIATASTALSASESSGGSGNDFAVPQGIILDDLMEAARLIPDFDAGEGLSDLRGKCEIAAKVYEHLTKAAARNTESARVANSMKSDCQS